MGADYKLPPVLELQLKDLNYTSEDIEEKIKEYSEEARIYINAELEGFEITEAETCLIRNDYIQYRLFADVEMESLVEDKRVFIKDLLNNIRKNKLRIKEEKETEAKEIFVF